MHPVCFVGLALSYQHLYANLTYTMKLFKSITQMFSAQPAEPEAPNLHELLAAAQQAQYDEQYDEALRWLDAVEEKLIKENNPTHRINLALNRADIFMLQKRFEDARTLLETTLADTQERQLRTPEAYIYSLLGQISQAEDNWSEARNYYQQAMDIAKSIHAQGALGRAMGHLAEVYVRDDNLSYGIKLYRDALPLLQESGDTALIPYFMYRLADTLQQVKRLSESDVLLIRGLERARTMQHRGYGRIFSLKLGERAFEDGKFEAAKQHFEFALQFSDKPLPATAESITLHLRLAHTALNSDHKTADKHHEKALTLIEQLEDQPTKAEMLALSGELWLNRGDSEKAYDYFQQAMTLYDTLPPAKTTISTLQQLAKLQSDKAESLKLLEKAHQLANALKAEALIAAIEGDTGDHYYAQHQPEKAVQNWEKALTYYQTIHEHDKLACYYSRIACAWLWLGHTRHAGRELEKALMNASSIEDASQKSEVMLNAARIYTATGNYESAENFYQQSITLATETGNPEKIAESRVFYGRFLALLEDTAPALLELREAHQLSHIADLNLLAMLALDGIAMTLTDDHNLPEALNHHEQVMAGLDTSLYPIWSAYFAMNFARTLIQLSRYDDARIQLDQAEEHGRTYHHAPLVAETLLYRAELLLMEDRSEDAKALLDEIEGLLTHLQQRRITLYFHLLSSRYHAETKNHTEAQTSWDTARDIMKTLNIEPPEAPWLT